MLSLELVPQGFSCTYSLDQCANEVDNISLNTSTVVPGNLMLVNNTMQVNSSLIVRGDLNVNSTAIMLEGTLIVQADLIIQGGAASSIAMNHGLVNASGNLVASGNLILADNSNLVVGGCLDGADARLNYTLTPDERSLLENSGTLNKQIASYSCLKTPFANVALQDEVELPQGYCSLVQNPNYERSMLMVSLSYQKCDATSV